MFWLASPKLLLSLICFSKEYHMSVKANATAASLSTAIKHLIKNHQSTNEYKVRSQSKLVLFALTVLWYINRGKAVRYRIITRASQRESTYQSICVSVTDKNGKLTPTKSMWRHFAWLLYDKASFVYCRNIRKVNVRMLLVRKAQIKTPKTKTSNMAQQESPQNTAELQGTLKRLELNSVY